jgi:hypothetical protein
MRDLSLMERHITFILSIQVNKKIARSSDVVFMEDETINILVNQRARRPPHLMLSWIALTLPWCMEIMEDMMMVKLVTMQLINQGSISQGEEQPSANVNDNPPDSPLVQPLKREVEEIMYLHTSIHHKRMY